MWIVWQQGRALARNCYTNCYICDLPYPRLWARVDRSIDWAMLRILKVPREGLEPCLGNSANLLMAHDFRRNPLTGNHLPPFILSPGVV